MHFDKVVICFLISSACGLVGCKTTELPAPSVYEVLPGTWGSRLYKDVGCDSNPHVISFSEDRSQMTLRYAQPARTVLGEAMTLQYKVLSDEPHLRVQLEGERRRNPSTDKLVVWDLIMVSADQYCWHRADRRLGSCSSRIVRCQAD